MPVCLNHILNGDHSYLHLYFQFARLIVSDQLTSHWHHINLKHTNKPTRRPVDSIRRIWTTTCICRVGVALSASQPVTEAEEQPCALLRGVPLACLVQRPEGSGIRFPFGVPLEAPRALGSPRTSSLLVPLSPEAPSAPLHNPPAAPEQLLAQFLLKSGAIRLSATEAVSHP